MSEEVKEGPYHEYRDHHDFNCDFCMSGEDAAYYSNLLNKAFHSRDAEVESLTDQLTASCLAHGAEIKKNQDLHAEVAELKERIEALTTVFNREGKITVQWW